MSELIPQTPDSGPETTSPTPIIGDSETVNNKFNWLKNSKNARRNPFVSARPHLTHTQSSSDLLATQSESRSDIFQNSRLNLFDTVAPKPATSSRYNSKGISLWGSRSLLEKLLLVICGVLLVLVIILIITVSMEAAGGNTVIFPDDNGSSMCLSSACIYTASQIIRSLDETKDPCEDFYEFACNGWIKNNPIPDGKANWGIFSKIDLQNQLIIRNAIEKLGKDKDNKSRSDAARKAFVFYDACMDTNETIEALGGKPLLDIIMDLGGWHIIPKSTNNMMTTWKLQSLIQKIQNKYNRDAFFNWAVAEDDRNSSINIIVFDQSGLTLPTRDTYLNQTAHKKVLDAYLVYMTKVCVLLGATESTVREEMKRVIALETAMANITIPSQDRRDGESLYNPMTISEFQKLSPFLNWKLFLNDAFNLIGRKISDKEKIVIYAPEYFKKLSHLLETYVETEQGQKTITSYLMWQITHAMSSYLSKAFRDATKGLQKALFGSDGNEELWRYCVTETNNALGFAVGAMFVRDVFDGDSKLQAQIMINQIRTAFKDNLKNIDWMDPQTKRLAEIKADAITDMIGFPDYILNKNLLDAHYADLKVHPSQYFKNNLEVNKFTFRRNLEKLDEPVNRTKWGMIPSTVNAYYTPTKNQIVFPAGILQLPFYNDENPRSVNYGAMGVVMGHELTHAFDDQGREYDQYGNLNQWWNNATVKQFKQRTDCFQKQYSNFSVNKQHLNGKQTLGENIADNGGLKAAYHAYLDYSREAKINQTLPGLRYTHTQTFFISFAQVWCSSMTKEATKLQIEKDDHAVAKYRVIGSLSNLKEFSEQFHCKPGTKMNPFKKCEIW